MPPFGPVMTGVKDLAKQLIDTLPDDVSMDDIAHGAPHWPPG